MKFKFYKHLLLVSLFSAPIIAQNLQDLDDSFLKSLPDDIASDLLDRSQSKISSEQNQYRRPSTFIDKPEENSNRFGVQVFSMMQTSLMPINEPNFDSSYILDFGDQLELQLTGQESSITTLNIKRDGSVNIIDIGKIFLAGLSLNEAGNLIKSKIGESFIGVESYLTLVNVRDIQIIMAGNVYNPGAYVLNGNSNIFHALSVSGGPSEFGSFRSIDLIRNNKKIESIDLYQTFIFARSSFDTRLRSGDIIFVNPAENIITVSGGLKRPGEYELLENENLSMAITFANGVGKFADLSDVKLERILDGQIKPLSISSLSQFDNIKSRDGDRIFIRNFSFRNVSIQGAVINPGNYIMNEGDSVLDAIAKAGGYSKNAYPFGGIYENEEIEEINRKAKETLYADFLDKILLASNTQGQEGGDLKSLIDIVSQLQASNPTGRVVVDFNAQDSENTPLVRSGDKIIIPEFQNHVYVYGEVASEGTVLYETGKNLSYYIDRKGGLNNNADKKSIYVVHPNGITDKVIWNKNVFVRQGKEVELYPGSIIFVPFKINNEYAKLLRSQAYVGILSSLGISLASLSVLKD